MAATAMLGAVPRNRTATARFVDATPVVAQDRVGFTLAFRPERSRLGVERVEDFADFGIDGSPASVDGLGKVLRLLRAARLATPANPDAHLRDMPAAAALLTRAEGTLVRLELRPRFRMRFVAWTEQGVKTIDDISEVRELDDGYYVMRNGSRVAVRFGRDTVIRQRTEQDRWYEIVDIERS